MTASGPDPDRDAARAAITRGIAFIAAEQDANGEIPVFTPVLDDPDGTLVRDPSIFPTALAAQALANIPAAQGVRQRALRFLLHERRWPGLWGHWPRSHPWGERLPPDINDTSCASEALRSSGLAGGATTNMLLANRAENGLFLTWIVPRLRSLSPRLLGLTWRQALWPLRQYRLGDVAVARPDDIDAVVNANALYYLGCFEGHELVVEHLLDILRTGREHQCDKWYDNPFVVRYFFARALARTARPARELFARRCSAQKPATALEFALQINTLSIIGLPVPAAAIMAMLEMQRDEGSWPRSPLYIGGRKRLPDGGFCPPRPFDRCWGSKALTTVFALEALARWSERQGAFSR